LSIIIPNTYAQSNFIEQTGDILHIFIPTAGLSTSIIKKDTEGSLQFGKGYLLNYLSTKLIKAIIKKERPDGSNYNSFPSGHTSSSFQGAAFIQRRYGWKFGIPAYALAGFVGFSRIHAKKHDTVDVIAGMVIGIGSAYIFTTPYQKEHLELTFSNANDSYQLGLKFKF
jgi:membrane-associated phospholipid phosphatase